MLPRARVLLLALAGVGMVLLLSLPRQLQDLDVYRSGGLALLHGRDPYAVVTGPARLPFTYPPFATVLALPLGALPRWLDAVALFAGDAAALFAVHRWLLPRFEAAGGRNWRLLRDPVVFACAALLLVEPVRSSAAYGQVNLLLLGLVVTDLTRAPTRTTGVLTGVAAAVKLTPLVFLGWLVVTGQWRSAARGGGAFLVAGLLAFAAEPGPSRDYWQHYAGDASRVGTVDYGSNQALSGLFARQHHGVPAHGWVIMALVLVLAAAGLAVSAAWSRTDRDLSMCLAALTGLVVSPISWSHHWVWLLPTALLLLGRRELALRAGGGLLLAVCLLGAPSWFGRGDLEPRLPDLLLGETYLFAGLIGVAVAGWSLTRLPGLAATSEPATGPGPVRVAARAGPPS